MKKGQWVKVDQADLNLVKNEKVQGIKVQMMISPSDVPKAIRGRVEGEKPNQKVVIEFQYRSAPEKTLPYRIEDGLSLDLGKNSRRIYSIRVDCKHVMDDFDGKFALEMLMRAEAEYGSSPRDELNVMNSTAVKGLLDKFRDRPLAHAM